MKVHFFLIAIFIGFCATAFGQTDTPKVVYEAGTEGYKSYRIPAIVKAPNGDLLAFGEGRVDGPADFGNVKILMKRSTDNGKTWSDASIIAENDTLQASNSAPVVDYLDPEYPNGRLFFFYNTGNNDEFEVRKGNGERRIWFKTSTDNGHSWSEEVEITSMVKKPEWRTYANTPGHAMQIQTGPYKGRIYVAANHSVGDPLENFLDYKAHGYYTDNHGKTFQLSEVVDFPGSNESTAAVLPDGGLMLNSRDQSHQYRARIISISKDGGQSWEETYVNKNLPDPINQGSLLNLDESGKLLAFSNAADPNNRINLTLKISEDGGKTWTKSFLVDEEGESTAYSDIVVVSENEIGVLYERKGYSQIVFKIIQWR